MAKFTSVVSFPLSTKSLSPSRLFPFSSDWSIAATSLSGALTDRSDYHGIAGD